MKPFGVGFDRYRKNLDQYENDFGKYVSGLGRHRKNLDGYVRGMPGIRLCFKKEELRGKVDGNSIAIFPYPASISPGETFSFSVLA